MKKNIAFILGVIVCCLCSHAYAQGSLYESTPRFGPGTTYYTFQVETLSVQANAEAYTLHLRDQGYPAYIAVLKTSKGKSLYKVRVGKFLDEAEARRAAEDFKTRAQKPAFLVISREEGRTAVKSPSSVSDSVPTGTTAAVSEKGSETVPTEAPGSVTAEKITTSVPPAPSDQPARTSRNDFIRTETVTPGSFYYTIQTCTEKVKSLADSRLEDLLKKGYPAYIVDYKTRKGKTIYKVRMGRFLQETDARRAAQRYHAKEKEPFLVVKSKLPAMPHPESSLREALPEAHKEQPVPLPVATLPAGDSGATGMRLEDVAPGKPYYTIQTSTRQEKEKADRQRNALREKGYPAYVFDYRTTKGTTIYKVRIGRFRREADARRAAQRYHAKEKEPYLVVKSTLQIMTGEPQAPALETEEPPQAVEVPQKLKEPGAVLPEKTVEEPAKTKPAAGRTVSASPGLMRFEDINSGTLYYTIQVHVEADKGKADKLLGGLRSKGYPAYSIDYRTSKGKVLYKVRIGRFRLQSDAIRAAEQYYAREKKPFLVVQSAIVLNPVEGVLAAGTFAQPQQSSGTVMDTSPEEGQAWPQKLSKIYAYRWPGDELNLTNTYEKIPRHLRSKIEYIAVFPVRYTGRTGDAGAFLFEIEGKQRSVRLAGVKLPDARAEELAREYLGRTVLKTPLRIKYDPRSAPAESDLAGRIYLQNGTYINLEMVRKGIGVFCMDTVVPGQGIEFKKAAALAQEEKKGIWKKRK